MPSIVFLTSDLMFSSRVAGAANTLGVSLQLVAQPANLPARLSADCQLVFVDLSLAGLELTAAIAAVRAAAPQARILAFGAHVDEASLAAAQSAGCDAVLSRGQFHKQYIELLKSVQPPGQLAGPEKIQ
jgi:DNA-binding NarL/FixJ family response regulator